MARIYVASPFTAKRTAKHTARLLSRAQHQIVSTWHNGPETCDPADEELRQRFVASDLSEVARADVVVALLEAGTTRGAYIECGFALALNKPIVWRVPLDGKRNCLFDSHPLVVRIRLGDDISSAIGRALERRKVA